MQEGITTLGCLIKVVGIKNAPFDEFVINGFTFWLAARKCNDFKTGVFQCAAGMQTEALSHDQTKRESAKAAGSFKNLFAGFVEALG